MKNLVMFDYDGVIVDSFDIFTSSFMEACSKSSYCHIESKASLMELFNGNLFEGMKTLGMDSRKIDHTLKIFQEIISEHLDTVTLFSGMAEAIKTISFNNHIFVITSNVSPVVIQVLSRNGVDFVEDVLGAEKERSKTNKIKKTMARYANRPAYYIGDTIGDIIEGKKAGALTVAVTWGWHETENLEKASPDFMVSSPVELTELLAS